jgi:hypothetical protein
VEYLNDKTMIFRAEADEITGQVTLYAIDSQTSNIYRSSQRDWEQHRFHLERLVNIETDALDKAGVDLTFKPHKVSLGNRLTSDTQLRQLGMTLT